MSGHFGSRISSLTRKILKSLAKRGLIGTVTFGADVAASSVRELLPARIRARAAVEAAHREFDLRYGVDTATDVSITSLDVTSENWIYGNRYAAIGMIDFAEILRDLKVCYEESVFIDLGSGKGRAVLLAGAVPFKQIIGVEFSSELIHVAERNLGIYPEELKRCKDIQFHCMDASLFEFPDEPLVIYLYNPFERPVMDRVIHNVTESYRKNRRRILVLYFTPECGELWDGQSIFSRVFTSKECHIYDTGSHSGSSS